MFFAQDVSDIRRPEKRFCLTAAEIALLNPNTGNCPIFRTQADAELTKAIYRRVPILWREATEDQPSSNPWCLRFSQGLFNTASDSHHFRTAGELRADGYRLEGNVFVSPYDRYLPLYEAKMLHQFDHRWATYDSEGDARNAVIQDKLQSSFMVQPRYWVREEVVESAIPKAPEPLAMALSIEHRSSIQRVLSWWSAGFHLHQGNSENASKLIYAAGRYDLDKSVARLLNLENPEAASRDLQDRFPLTLADAKKIVEHISRPESVARELVDQFSPKWLMGWRDITNATNERTTISSLLPKAAVGDTFLLMFSQLQDLHSVLSLPAILNSFVQDYGARQKVGGTHMKYNVFRQLPVLSPKSLQVQTSWDASSSIQEWLFPRVIELVYTALDLTILGVKACAGHPPFAFNESRRHEIRCELDAAMFHLYLPAENSGDWRLVDYETKHQLVTLKQHFVTPRDAVVFILDQFPITRQNEEKAHGHYRTKHRILEIYDAMLTAQRSSQQFQTKLNPPPGRY